MAQVTQLWPQTAFTQWRTASILWPLGRASFLSADAHQLEGEQNLVHLEGLQVNLVYFENLGGQEELRVHMGIMHDQESSSNRYKQTSFESKYEIIQAARAKVAGRPLQSLHLFWKCLWFLLLVYL